MIHMHLVVADPQGPIISRPLADGSGRLAGPAWNPIRRGGRYRIVCQPGRRDFGKVKMDRDGNYLGEGTHLRCTSEPALVSCPKCRKSPVFIAHDRPLGRLAKEEMSSPALAALAGVKE